MQRYESYKRSDIPWVGDIPSHWEVKKNKFLLSERKAVVGKDAPNFKLLSLTLQGVILRDMENPKGKFPAEFDTYKQVAPDDLIFCLFDVEETPRTVGLAKHHGMITGAYTVTRCNEQVSSAFLYYYYLSLDEGKQLRSLYTGLRNVITRDTFFSLAAPFPPREEQDRIVAFLDQKTAEIDAAIAKKERLIELLNEQRYTQVNRAVTLGMDQSVSLRKSESEWIESLPDHWEIVPLKHISTVQSGVTLGKNYASSKTTKSFPYLRVANVQDGYIDLSTVTEIVLPVREAKNYLLRTGDILVTEGGDIDKLGRGNCWDGQIEECLHQNHVFAVRILKRVRPEFVALITGVSYARRYFTTTANKTTNLASTNKTKLGNLPVLVPPLLEQDAILDFCNGVKAQYEALISSVSREISALKEMKSSLVADAVTGRIKV